ncbi:hypothetical protein ANCCAN_29567, partial [Ancylostoma caninum]
LISLCSACANFFSGNSVDYRFVRTHKTDGSALLKFTGTRPAYDQEKFVNVPIKKGSLIIIHGLVVHKSAPNTSLKSRHAYTLHVMEGKNTKWSPDNWYVREFLDKIETANSTKPSRKLCTA